MWMSVMKIHSIDFSDQSFSSLNSRDGMGWDEISDVFMLGRKYD